MNLEIGQRYVTRIMNSRRKGAIRVTALNKGLVEGVDIINGGKVMLSEQMIIKTLESGDLIAIQKQDEIENNFNFCR